MKPCDRRNSSLTRGGAEIRLELSVEGVDFLREFGGGVGDVIVGFLGD